MKPKVTLDRAKLKKRQKVAAHKTLDAWEEIQKEEYIKLLVHGFWKRHGRPASSEFTVKKRFRVVTSGDGLHKDIHYIPYKGKKKEN